MNIMVLNPRLILRPYAKALRRSLPPGAVSVCGHERPQGGKGAHNGVRGARTQVRHVTESSEHVLTCWVRQRLRDQQLRCCLAGAAPAMSLQEHVLRALMDNCKTLSRP